MKVYVVNILANHQMPIAVYSDFDAARARCQEFLEIQYPEDTFIEKSPGYFSRKNEPLDEFWYGYIAGFELDPVAAKQSAI
jgi:hypothetical protein